MPLIVSDSETTDEQLAAEAARRGDSVPGGVAARAAFERLYRRHAPLLLAFIAARALPSDRDDLHQGVWQQVWEHLPHQFQGGNFRAWLYTIARNALIDHGRKSKPGAVAALDHVPDVRARAVDSGLIDAERMNALRHCMKKLRGLEAAIIEGRLAGESYPELCGRLGLDQNRAYGLCHSAANQLKTCVERALG